MTRSAESTEFPADSYDCLRSGASLEFKAVLDATTFVVAGDCCSTKDFVLTTLMLRGFDWLPKLEVDFITVEES